MSQFIWLHQGCSEHFTVKAVWGNGSCQVFSFCMTLPCVNAQRPEITSLRVTSVSHYEKLTILMVKGMV
jgi:hypothetical protein